MELVELLLAHQYSVGIFSYSGPSGILGSEGKQNTVFAGARGMKIITVSISSNEKAQLNQICCFSIIEGSLYF